MQNLANRVQLIGHLGMDPESKTLENGTVLSRFSIATNESYRNAQGERITDTQWHTLVAWNKTAELAAQLLKKGKEVAVDCSTLCNSFDSTELLKKSNWCAGTTSVCSWTSH